MTTLRALLLALVLACTAAVPAKASELIADLSQHLIAITTGFSGANVLLFGSVEAPGDVVVAVSGPKHDITVRRKARVGGVWVNNDQMTFASAPAFYALASSAPIRKILSEGERGVHKIGVHHLSLTPKGEEPPDRLSDFREALIRNKQNQGLYAEDAGKILFLGKQLFRTDITFPANAPVGTYEVQVLLVRDGKVVAAEITPLSIGKVGFEANVYNFAYDYGLLYGLLAIVVATVAGWLASVAFRKS
ncbi:MAG: TIGR02186 family protein [Rhodobacterales bacterium]|nr:TIGR02186 family protein [Rhodobacterales bacterium]